MSKRVLIVDDEESIRSSLDRLLSYEKYKTFLAGDGKEALDTVSNERVDIVLLDIKMPGMDGLEVLAKLKEMNPELPVIIISGHGNIATAVEATKLGAFVIGCSLPSGTVFARRSLRSRIYSSGDGRGSRPKSSVSIQR